MAAGYCLFVALLSVVVISITTGQGDQGGWGKCCMPDSQFMVLKSGLVASSPLGLFGKLMGDAKGVYEQHHTFYDFDNNRFAARIERTLLSDPRKPMEHMMVMEEAEDPYVWVIDMDNQRCIQGSREEYPFHLARCVSPTAEIGGMGYLGDKELFVTGYNEYVPEPAISHGTYTVGVTDECLPYSEMFVGESESWGSRQDVVLSFQFYNYTVVNEEMMDMMDGMFEVPDFCYRNDGGRWWQ